MPAQPHSKLIGGFMMRRFNRKLIGIVISVLVVVIMVLGVLLFFAGNSGKEEKTVNVATLQQQVLSISELTTIKYDYTNVIDSSASHTIKGWAVPGTKKLIIAVLDGTMKIGIDVSKISIEDAQLSRTVTITIPKAEVLDHYPRDQRVLEEKDGLLNKVTIEDYVLDVAKAQQEMEEKARKDGLFARAEEEAVKMIEQFAGAFLPEGYMVEAVVAEAA